ncbi:hypothetical protein PTSG_03595 [Salpingoeca rosetta]|uniref:Uncharacterized protein n=1 Tax=Salpingoeca rosetta (strain ATCC 50818 / BSB-021) TaxID=946362 RepID=F2U620_SALR5|nr:uncharacterized protein PTSG_03595 [Salpingoeca rosetta]EGD82961.1 hypothetical protein PTSG_03595 [Salpingoeca rosetta]|eukprot:XP_004995325.1 hypothetical protein PTSG_03595 [Salpingoeca rosetta]
MCFRIASALMVVLLVVLIFHTSPITANHDHTGVVRLPLDLELYEDVDYVARVDPNNEYAQSCVHDVDDGRYDFRPISGSYVVSSKADKSQFRINLCVPPKECNGQNSTTICRQKRLAREAGIEAIIEVSMGSQPLWDSAFKPSDYSLRVPYTDGSFGKTVQDIQSALTLAELFAHSELSTNTAAAIDAAVDELRRHATQSIPMTVVDFSCDPSVTGRPEFVYLGPIPLSHGTWYGVEPTQDLPADLTAAYGLMIAHACVCPNATCHLPDPPRKPPRPCHEEWDRYIFKNIPAIAIVRANT